LRGLVFADAAETGSTAQATAHVLYAIEFTLDFKPSQRSLLGFGGAPAAPAQSRPANSAESGRL
jgi:hypothetical protein